jgi:hypothetical protein
MSETMAPIETPQLLLDHHLKALRLPTMLREYDRVARQCAAEDLDYPRYLLRTAELELLDRERRATERRIRQAKFPATKKPRQLRLPCHADAQQGDGAGTGAVRVPPRAARTCCCSATPAPAKRTSRLRSVSPPASKATASASPPPLPWSTS